ncbi:MAG TPA: hypothetical protein VKB54_01410 [Solirubrobacteraceae bacterium]|nr:hypothetical protein [Solirubrobacteraceae bacterium]
MGRRLIALLLIALMAIGSIVLWLGIPLGWLYLVSRLVNSSQPSMGPYILVLVGIPASMVIVGKLLSKLNRVYGDVTGTTPTGRARTPWLRSMRGERDTARPRTVLDVVMIWSVALALVCFAIWFFVFAGSSLPT